MSQNHISDLLNQIVILLIHLYSETWYGRIAIVVRWLDFSLKLMIN
jgi:hypothetical protein